MDWTRSRFRVQLGAALVVATLLGWLSTGTLAGYAVGLDIARVWLPCRYLVNVDHGDFLASFAMLSGAPADAWAWAVTLRRALYPLLAFPAMTVLGFEYGGILTNFALAWAAVVGFPVWVKGRHGERAAIGAAWLVATFPALHYWIGLPYSYAMVVPSSLAAVAILWELEGVRRPAATAGLSLVLGVLYVGYDLAPFFLLPSLALVTLAHRRAGPVLASLGLQVGPSALTLLVLTVGLGVPLHNSNSGIYANVARAWMQASGGAAWWSSVAGTPGVLLQNFLASGFVWLPLLFLVAIAGRSSTPRLARPEKAVLAMALVIWAFNNLAPPYAGKWQMRGEWIARLYVPVFAVYLTVVVRWLERSGDQGGARDRRVPGLVTAAVVLNALVMLGPFLGLTGYTARMYAAFYAHAPPGADYGRDPVQVAGEHLAALGRRPIGFCKPP
jgi:hypothetical protein